MADLNSLTTCAMKEISGLSYLDEVLMKSLTKVMNLEIEDCKELTCLWKNNEGHEEATRSGNLLKRFIIKKCKELMSLWKKGQAIQVQAGGGLKLLEKVNIMNCGALETLPDWWCALEDLSIMGCPLIKSLSRSNLPTTLKKVDIQFCQNLECLPDELMGITGGCCHLEHLSFTHCPSLKSFPPGKFPVTLQNLNIFNSKQLSPLLLLSDERFEENIMLQLINVYYTNVGFGHGLGRLKHLTYLYISSCDDLVSFPKNVFMSTPKLRELTLMTCKNLKSLPYEMHKLLSLQSIKLHGCPGIIEFPEGGLPPKLTTLSVGSCSKLKQPISEWGLNTLEGLELRGPIGSIDDIVSFPDKDGNGILPPSLTKIIISNFKNMESISSSLQNLTYLQELSFNRCPKLKSLPKEVLPDSLGSLEIEECPVGERCIKEEGGGGDYWPHISHIPLIKITITKSVNDNGELVDDIRKYSYTGGFSSPLDNFFLY